MLGKMAITRRAMYLAEHEGLTTQRDFAAKLGMIMSRKYNIRQLIISSGLDMAVARPVYQGLKNEGYIISVGGAHKKAKFNAVKDGPYHEKMMKVLFDPFMHISHHVSTIIIKIRKSIADARKYNLPAKHDTEKKSFGHQPLVSQASIMPPPKTPAPRLRRKPTTPSTTGLDLRASVLPLDTPSRAPSLQNQKSKRGRDKDAITETPNKRSALPLAGQLRISGWSEFVLDAGGLASSPAASSNFSSDR